MCVDAEVRILQKSTGKRLAFEILLALFLVVLLIAILATELSRASEAYLYKSAKLVTYTQADTLTGYVFREESTPMMLPGDNGPIDYQVKDGTSVLPTDVLAFVYRDDEGKNKREQAAALYAQIAELEDALMLADETAWKSAYVSDYTTLMRELSANNVQGALSSASDTAAALGGRDAQKKSEDILSRIDALRAELTALTENTPDHHAVYPDESGVFYRTADGYEALFGINQIADLTPAALDVLLASQPATKDVIGKLVSTDTPWYFAVPLDRALAETYTQGKTYPLHFAKGSATMLLERIYTDDTARALLIFRGEESPAWLPPARKQSASVEKGSVTGFSIPADALSQDNTVFVIQDKTACLRHVTPLLREQGCLLIAPGEMNGLTEGDRVIVSTKQLFDGKVLE